MLSHFIKVFSHEWASISINIPCLHLFLFLNGLHLQSSRKQLSLVTCSVLGHITPMVGNAAWANFKYHCKTELREVEQRCRELFDVCGALYCFQFTPLKAESP